MKIQVQSKKGLQTTLSIIIDKLEVKKKLDIRLTEYQKQIDLKVLEKEKFLLLLLRVNLVKLYMVKL